MWAKSGAATRAAVCLVVSMLAKRLAFAFPADVLGDSMFAFSRICCIAHPCVLLGHVFLNIILKQKSTFSFFLRKT
jgi:hypothetical protein